MWAEKQLSVVICAYTMARWNDINEAIESIRQQTLRPAEIILVVDHNDELLARAVGTFPDVSVIANRATRGLSGARNTGITAATGAAIAFLDDDAVADQRWLEQLANACEPTNVLGATGPVSPLWIGARPDWLPEEFLWIVGCSFRGSPTGFTDIRNVTGGSMLIKRDVFDLAGVFNSALGRMGPNLVSCEETELCIRAKAAIPDARFVWTSAALIHHKVPAWRLTWKYFAARCYAEGLSKAYLTRLVAHDSLGTERTYVARTLTSGALAGLADAVKRGRIDGAKRAAAIAIGLGSAALGFARGKLSGSSQSSGQNTESRSNNQTFRPLQTPGATTTIKVNLQQ
jgi:GT2 family glycosyltransferase